MRATLSWIKEFVDFEMEPEELADRLTNIGLECTVDLEGQFDQVVVGEVTEVSPHPNADHLKVCKVLAGSKVYSVVCGAPNTQVNAKAPLAPAGTSLPGGLKIRTAEIRGIRSEGMLCSEAELEVGEDASGLWILPDDLPIGLPLDEVLELRDWVFEFDLTPNRGDCLSILGLAHEVAAVTGAKVKIPLFRLHEEGKSAHENFRVTIQDPDLCPRYVARIVEGIKVQQSPLWMRRRLQLVGLRAINNLVDVTNYVMWELGQPLHAFDLDLLEGEEIVVKRARDGETFVSLDGEPRTLNNDMLMIWDGVKPVAVAGVMGGQNSEVRSESRNVLIESAHFSPVTIRRTSRKLGMVTEASRRFERGIDPEGCARAAGRAAQLMSELAGGKVMAGHIDAHPSPGVHVPLSLRLSKVNALLGTRFETHQVRSLLSRLDLQVEDGGDGTLQVLPPTRRVDLTREVDLIEEVARVWGYDRIPATLPRTAMVSGLWSPERLMELRVKEIMVGLGFHEIITFAFVDQSGFDRLELPPDDPLRTAVVLQNPIRQDQQVMRTTLLPGLLNTVRRNLHHKNLNLRLFELGRVFFPQEGELLPLEPSRIGCVMCGTRYPDFWNDRKRVDVDFFDLKGAVERLLHMLQISQVRFYRESAPVFLRKGFRASIHYGQDVIGWLGELAPSVSDSWDLETTPSVFEIDFDFLVRAGSLERRFSPLPRYPEVVRDLSFLVDQSIQAEDILNEILQSGVKWLHEAYLLDLFTEGKAIAKGQKSLTFRVLYRSSSRSLTDEEVNEQQGRIIEYMENKFKARLRS